MKHREPQFDDETRVVTWDEGSVCVRVPSLLGSIESATIRGDYVIVQTAEAKVSYYRAGSRHSGRYRMAGTMPWQSIRKLVKDHCFIESLRKRVDFHITHYRYPSGCKGSSGVAGAILVDRRVVSKGAYQPGPNGFVPHELVAALADSLEVTPQEALRSDRVLARSLALISRRLSEDEFLSTDQSLCDHPVWHAFYALRMSLVQDRTRRDDVAT